MASGTTRCRTLRSQRPEPGRTTDNEQMPVGGQTQCGSDRENWPVVAAEYLETKFGLLDR